MIITFSKQYTNFRTPSKSSLSGDDGGFADDLTPVQCTVDNVAFQHGQRVTETASGRQGVVVGSTTAYYKIDWGNKVSLKKPHLLHPSDE